MRRAMNLNHKIFLLLVTLFGVSAKNDRIRLKDVETLTLYSDKWTTSRRSSPVKQLNCVGGSCSRASVETAQCYNRGFDGNDVQWECKAELPSNFKFGRLEVTCEGYEYPNDDYVLVGSCGLEYTISEVSKTSDSYFPSYSYPKDNANDGYGSSMLTIVVVIGAAIALYFYLRPTNNQPNNNAGHSRFNSNPSAPPPPGFRPDFCGTTGDSSYTSGSGASSTGTSNRPGFFSGMTAGSVLGYMFGSWNRGNTGYGYGRRNHRDNSFWNTPSSSGYSSFGSLNSNYGSSRGSTTRSTSTSFASTKRR